MIYGYIRVSTDKQDLDAQKILLLEYAVKNKIEIDEFIQIEISSKKDKKQRRIDELTKKLKAEDILIVAELSRLGRNMLEVMGILNEIISKDVKIIFIRQPELSTTEPHQKLLLAIYSYFAETERDFISSRTKAGLVAARQRGAKLGRPPGRKSQTYKLSGKEKEIKKYLEAKVTKTNIARIFRVDYKTMKNFIDEKKL